MVCARIFARTDDEVGLISRIPPGYNTTAFQDLQTESHGIPEAKNVIWPLLAYEQNYFLRLWFVHAVTMLVFIVLGAVSFSVTAKPVVRDPNTQHATEVSTQNVV